MAEAAGASAVKFQKRTPELCVPKAQRSVMRETPWGYISYMDYREKVEFGKEQWFSEIDKYCKEHGIVWFLHLLSGTLLLWISWSSLIRPVTKSRRRL